jgi:hypothetical protein
MNQNVSGFEKFLWLFIFVDVSLEFSIGFFTRECYTFDRNLMKLFYNCNFKAGKRISDKASLCFISSFVDGSFKYNTKSPSNKFNNEQLKG